MKNACLVAIMFGLTSTSANAQVMRAEGDFASRNVFLRTLVLDSEKGVVAVSSAVTLGACSGEITGIGEMKAKSLRIKPYEKLEDGEDCVLQIDFSNDWQSAKLSGKNCSAYHGASCGWEGQEVKRKKK